MKKLIFLLLLWPGVLNAAVLHVQSTGISSSGQVASVSKAFTGAVTAGNAILVGGGCYFISTCDVADNIWSDDKSNSYTSVVASFAGNTAVGFAVNVAAGVTTVTLTPSASNWLGLGMSEFSGVASAPTDANAEEDTTGANASVAITSTSTGVLYAVLNLRDIGGTISVGSGWTQVYEDEDITNFAGSIQYRIAAAGNYNCDWTSPDQTVNGWSVACMSLKEAAVVGRRPIAPIMY